MKFLLNTLLFFFVGTSLLAQDAPLDSLPPLDSDTLIGSTIVSLASDSSTIKAAKKKKSLKGFFKKDYPIPKRAMLLSLVVPGAGQAYNKKYWKIPLAVGGTATAIFFVVDNTKTYRRVRDEVRLRYNPDLDIEPDPILQSWEVDDLETERDLRQKWLEMSYIAVVLVQGLAGVDAFVDAHMNGYEINEDLTMKFKPTIESTSTFGPIVGLGLSFHLTAPPTPQPKTFLFETP